MLSVDTFSYFIGSANIVGNLSGFQFCSLFRVSVFEQNKCSEQFRFKGAHSIGLYWQPVNN